MTQVRAIPQAARLDEAVVAVASQPALAATPFFARDAVRFVCLFLQFGLLVYLVRRFDIERGPLGDVLVLAWLGFAVHHCLPHRLRMPFFAALSMASIPLVVGRQFGAIVCVGGLLLIAICHAPCRLLWRLLALGAMGGVLLLLRRYGTAPAVVLLASMFMFRIIIYLYDLKHRSAPFSFFRATSYFFMLPNACFQHLPIVDYKTFATTYYNDQPLRIYQTGLRWILRGLLHLLLYRALYQFAQIDPLTVTDLGGAARFMVVTYLLYLRVSGQFHLIIGTLHLFGFNLPETHHLYLLSSSFLDLWRRINIYWKDFILKIFFNPAYFFCKRLGPTWAMVVATIYAFFWTWLLHSYQLLWLRGGVALDWQGASRGGALSLAEAWAKWAFSSITLKDTIFWALLGALVLASALWEMKRYRQRALHKMQRTWRTELYRAVCTIATFVTMCMLWTLWSCQSFDELGHVLAAATNVTLPSALAVTAGLLGLGVASVLFGRSVQERTLGSPSAKRAADRFAFWPSAGLLTAGALGLLCFAMIPELPAASDTTVAEVAQSLGHDRLNEIEVSALTRGYYEDLDVAREDVFFAQAILSTSWWPATKLHKGRDTFMLHEPIPNISFVVRGKAFEFNKLGMRGPEYKEAKTPGVFRIAVLGSSHEIGRGVNDDETFPRLLEERLNREDTNAHNRKFEVLNFAVEGYGAIQKLEYLKEKALKFDPDLVMFVTYRREGERTGDQIATALGRGYEFPEPFGTSIREICAKAHIDRSTPFMRMKRYLTPYVPRLVEEVFPLFAETCKKHHVRACVVYRPEPREFRHLYGDERRALLRMSEQAGLPVLDLFTSFAGVAKRESLMVEPEGTFDWQTMRREGIDDHPNERAHQLMADELYRQLHTPEGRGLLRPRDTDQGK